MTPHVGQHACGQLAETVGLLQDPVVHALSRRRDGVPPRELRALRLGYGAGEVWRATLCKWVVLQGRGRRRGGWSGRGGGRGGGLRRRRGVPEAAAAAAAGGVSDGGGGDGLGKLLAEQQHLLPGDLAVRGLRAWRAGVVQLLAAQGRVEGVCV